MGTHSLKLCTFINEEMLSGGTWTIQINELELNWNASLTTTIEIIKGS